MLGLVKHLATNVIRLCTAIYTYSSTRRVEPGRRWISSGSMSTATRNLKAVLIDLSGTIHIEDKAVPGSQAALQRLRKSALKVRFVTNTTKEPKRILYERLLKLGFDIQPEEIYTSLTAAYDLVKARGLTPMLCLEDCALEDFQGISQNNPKAVVIGLAPSYFDYDPMNRAFRLILNGAPLIAIHKARYFKKKDGLALGPGPFVEGLEFATGTKAEVVGKPERNFFLGALSNFCCQPEEAVMIGDDAKDDVAGAINIGMKGILVQTGKYRSGDENCFEPKPHFVCADFAAAVDSILSKLS